MNSLQVFKLLFVASLIVSAISAAIEKKSDLDDTYRAALENPNLFGGDIVLPRENNRFGINSFMRRWPKGTIPYNIASGRRNLKGQIEKAMRHIEDKTCIKFVPHTIEDDYITIFKGSSCFSAVGRSGGQQLLSLGVGCEPFGTIVHELMHAIGFFHQHQRIDRDSYLNIHWNNIDTKMYSQFQKLSPGTGLIYAPFDFDSIMLYDSKSFSKNGKVTMTAKNEKITLDSVWRKKYLSQSDIISINKMYNCY